MILRYISLVLLLSVATLFSTAQDETRGQTNSPVLSANSTPQVAVVPMMPKMFLSNVSGQLGTANGLNYKELRTLFIDKILENTVLSAESFWEVSEIDELNDSLVDYFHMASRFSYDPVLQPEKEDKSKVQEFWEKLQNKSEESETHSGVYLEKGEIKEFYDDKERFMNAELDTALVNSEPFQNLDTDYVLLINELDISKPLPNGANYGSGERTVKLHFTLYSKNGERLYGNASFATFDKSEFDVYKIINGSILSAINRMIAECNAHLSNLSSENKN